jgi:hypothetical protein
MSWISEIRGGLQALPQDTRSLQRFAAVLSSALLLIALFFFLAKRDTGTTLWFILAVLLLLAAAMLRPVWLRPLHTGWMALAFAIGGLVSRVILTLFFYGIITPLALVLRLIGKDFLHRKVQKEGASYWIRRPVEGEKKEDYRRLF